MLGGPDVCVFQELSGRSTEDPVAGALALLGQLVVTVSRLCLSLGYATNVGISAFLMSISTVLTDICVRFSRLIETAQQICLTHAVFVLSIQNWGNDNALLHIPKSLTATLVLTACDALLVEVRLSQFAIQPPPHSIPRLCAPVVLLLAHIQAHRAQMAEHNRSRPLRRALRRLDVLYLPIYAHRIRISKAGGGVEVADRDAAGGVVRE